MVRLGAVFWLIVVLVAGFATFKVKYAVQDLEDQLNRVRRHTIAEQQEIRVLNAEWTYLTQPERLADLNRRFLGLAPIAPKQLQRSIADIPLRPPAAPAPPDELVDVALDASPGPAASPTPADALPVVPAAPQPQASALPVTPAVLAAAGLGPIGVTLPARVQLAKAGAGSTARSLDALIAQIADMQ